MIALSGADIAWPLFGLAAVIIAVSVLTLVWRRAFQRLHAEVGKANVTLEAVNRAVNNVPPGTPPLPARIGQLERDVQEIKQALAALGPQQITINTGGTSAET